MSVESFEGVDSVKAEDVRESGGHLLVSMVIMANARTVLIARKFLFFAIMEASFSLSRYWVKTGREKMEVGVWVVHVGVCICVWVEWVG